MAMPSSPKALFERATFDEFPTSLDLRMRYWVLVARPKTLEEILDFATKCAVLATASFENISQLLGWMADDSGFSSSSDSKRILLQLMTYFVHVAPHIGEQSDDSQSNTPASSNQLRDLLEQLTTILVEKLSAAAEAEKSPLATLEHLLTVLGSDAVSPTTTQAGWRATFANLEGLCCGRKAEGGIFFATENRESESTDSEAEEAEDDDDTDLPRRKKRKISEESGSESDDANSSDSGSSEEEESLPESDSDSDDEFHKRPLKNEREAKKASAQLKNGEEKANLRWTSSVKAELGFWLLKKRLELLNLRRRTTIGLKRASLFKESCTIHERLCEEYADDFANWVEYEALVTEHASSGSAEKGGDLMMNLPLKIKERAGRCLSTEILQGPYAEMRRRVLGE